MPPGVLFSFAAYALYSCCDAIVKALGKGLTVYEIAFFTTLFSLVPALLMTTKGESWLRFYKLNNPLLVHIRGLSGVIGNLCIIYAFTSVPLQEVYSLSFLAPIFIVFISVALLKETVGWQRWLFLGLSFAGVLLVVKPGFRELHLGHLAAVGAAICGAVTTTALRKVSNSETRVSLIGIASAYILVVNGGLILVDGYRMLTLPEIGGLLAIGALGGTANLLFIAATRSSPASQIAPLQYSQIAWALLFGTLFYKEFPDGIAYAGLAVVVGAGILNVLSGETRIRIFSRLSPGGAGPAMLEESSTDAVLEAPVLGATEMTSKR